MLGLEKRFPLESQGPVKPDACPFRTRRRSFLAGRPYWQRVHSTGFPLCENREICPDSGSFML